MWWSAEPDEVPHGFLQGPPIHRVTSMAGDPDRQAFVGELVDHIEHPIFASIVRAVLDEVIGPDVIAVLGTQPDT